jgi:hypothetical protein
MECKRRNPQISNIFIKYNKQGIYNQKQVIPNTTITKFNLTLVKLLEENQKGLLVKAPRSRNRLVLPEIRSSIDTTPRKVFEKCAFTQTQTSMRRYKSQIKNSLVTYSTKGLSLKLDNRKVYPELDRNLIKDIDTIARRTLKYKSTVLKEKVN